ncbi:GNAT family N-acetyltransferase [Ramlibacter sp. G-1-2-2]|uniref:GNAT family N-acetyltransferase n=1 Tax=Ramlibacter agri TaxID=2728837 RepID=A0A848HAA5_9BURK|nr:GNAT family N-acetyltransferase [Ramlibacter agri]NML46390.1 GNAT family N-acetyltransferase [Ramlibacter agri]
MLDIEAIERATLAAVPPQRLEECQGWLVPLDDGTVGRAHSAAPTAHGAPGAGSIEAVEALYADAGLKTVFRVPMVAAVETELERRGYVAAKPTLVQWMALGDPHPGPLPLAGEGELRLAPSADASWEGVFLGEGFDPVDGASRLGILRRAQGSLYASVRVGGETVAVGCGSFSHGWGSVHGMRTLPAHRGRGHATRIIRAITDAARERGLARVFLQVEQGNAGARALYARLGFQDGWTYRYWKKA